MESKKRRNGNYSIYYSMVALVVLVIFVILSTTVFFKIETVTITGSSVYTTDEIIAASGISGGDNLIRTHMGKASEKIVKQLVYIETAELERAFPSGVKIHITPCVETASAEYDGKFCILSQSGKILDIKDEPVPETITIYGAQPPAVTDIFEEETEETAASGESVTSAVTQTQEEEAPEALPPAVIGEKFACAQEHRTDVFYLLLETAANAFGGKANFFDMTDYLNISCLYDDRITVEFGAISEFDYKIKFADNIITTKIGPETEGTLKMLSSGGVSFIDKAGLEQNEIVYQNNVNPVVSEEELSETDGSEASSETSQVINFE
ncbi:MAG: FtsQ-type POTRA domain-containing protein [Oscillospiraceae bacterium]|nr:FtsQ-type POTRA domain-containing protein [Oscillospiraceae bacterium]